MITNQAPPPWPKKGAFVHVCICIAYLQESQFNPHPPLTVILLGVTPAPIAYGLHSRSSSSKPLSASEYKSNWPENPEFTHYPKPRDTRPQPTSAAAQKYPNSIRLAPSVRTRAARLTRFALPPPQLGPALLQLLPDPEHPCLQSGSDTDVVMGRAFLSLIAEFMAQYVLAVKQVLFQPTRVISWLLTYSRRSVCTCKYVHTVVLHHHISAYPECFDTNERQEGLIGNRLVCILSAISTDSIGRGK